MDRKELIKKYLEFFKSKDHKVIPNASLIPENDPTALFISAGMHPLVPFLLGRSHPSGKRLVNVQKCVRTTDIEEVGDSCHHTFMEMLGNWSLGDYWKKEAIEYIFEFHTKILKIPLERYAVTCFKGNENSERDKESAKIWLDLGIKKERIAFLEDNWWGPAGKIGPCGPDTEMFYWKPNDIPAPKIYNPKDDNWVEIGNNVLMEFVKDKKGNYNKAKQKNVDFGGGFDRTLAVLNGFGDDYLTDTFKPIIEEIEKLSKEKYGKSEEITKAMRIIADHIRASVFIIADGVIPSNTEQGYVLRRLIRRSVRYGKKLKMKNFTTQLAEPIFKIFDDYKELKQNKKKILQELKKEEEKFLITLEKGLNRFKKVTEKKKQLSGKESFLLYQSFGFPIEMLEEECKKQKIKFAVKEFEKASKEHQELSRTTSAGKFKSGLADSSEATTKLHTTAHLLLTALKKALKDDTITQKGSNITPERLRLDFSFPRKLTEEEVKKVENMINSEIKKAHKVVKQEMSIEEAKKSRAEGAFEEKYGNKVSVYSIGDFSKEICAGPHVKNIKELGKFKISKQESVSAGVRRIKAILE